MATGVSGAVTAQSNSMGAVENAKKVLEGAKHFTKSVAEQSHTPVDTLAPKHSQYVHARAARQDQGHEFLGVRSDEAPAINTRTAAQSQYKKAVEE